MSDETTPQEVLAIAALILAMIAEKCACSNDVLVASLSVAASTIKETRDANQSARLRAEFIDQFRRNQK